MGGGGPSLFVLLDLSVAFDTIYHNILLDWLLRKGFGGLPLTWSYLDRWVQHVQLERFFPSLWTLNCGLPQESSVSPMLIKICMRSLGEVISSIWVHCHQHADDTELYLLYILCNGCCPELWVLFWSGTGRTSLSWTWTRWKSYFWEDLCTSLGEEHVPELHGVTLPLQDWVQN